jgi:hypothetical protein
VWRGGDLLCSELLVRIVLWAWAFIGLLMIFDRYDMEYSGPFYSAISFVRSMVSVLKIAELENEAE